MALNPLRRIGRMARVIREHGLQEFLSRAFGRLSYHLASYESPMLVAHDDAASVDWTQPPLWATSPLMVENASLDIAWVMSPPGETSGGHQNLFRFIRFAELAGHKCTIYFYGSDPAASSVDGVRAMLKNTRAYAPVLAEMLPYEKSMGVRSDTDVLFATGWETAYPVFLDKSLARRFYFVQDFEPGFYPLGTESILAENTYKFGFHGITAGGWLSHKLALEYGMKTDHFDFAVDKAHYNVTNLARRKEVFFYARPVTSRRAFEFGILVLKEFAELRPDVVINMGGWDVSSWKIPFPYKNLSAMDITELNAVYNRCAAGLVLSLSNMSLLPLELMSSGVTPVVNDGVNNRMVSDNPNIAYVPASPSAVARKLIEILDREDGIAQSVAMSNSVSDVNWDDSGSQFLVALERAMRG